MSVSTVNLRSKLMALDKARLALIVMGAVVVTEIVAIAILAGVAGAEIPDRVWDLLQIIFLTTLTALGSMVGAQALNGKIKDNKEVIQQMAEIVAELMEKKYDSAKDVSCECNRLRL